MPGMDDMLSRSNTYNALTSTTEISARLEAIRRKYSLTRRILTAVILSLLNIVNFFDRSIYGVVLPQIKQSFEITNSEAGLVQTVYVVSIIVAAPLAGVIGRKFSRKWAIILGSVAWCAAVVCGPLFSEGNFGVFCAIRCCAGLGESFLGTLAITIFADLFNERFRPLVLNIFMGGILLGASLAYFLGPLVTEQMAGVWDLKGWVWVTSGTGVVGGALLIPAVFIVPDVPMQTPMADARKSQKGALLKDLHYMIHCKSYVLTVLGYTCFSFTLGSKQYWSVTYITDASMINSDINLDQILDIVALLVFACGWVGSIGVGEIARVFKNRGFASAQPLVTGIVGMFSGLTFLGFMAFMLRNVPIAMTFYGITNITLCCYVATFQDLIMSVLPPVMRPLGAGMATLTGHLLGDGFSSLAIGAISDIYANAKSDPNTYYTQASALTTAFYLAEFVSTIGGMLFIIVALTLPGDLRKVKRFIKEKGIATQNNGQRANNNHFGSEDQKVRNEHRVT